MTLTDDEIADLRGAFICEHWPTLLEHVTELVAAYHAQGLVMGDLAHDGTVQWEAGAEDDGGWICEVCGCWNRTGDPCKFDGDDAHLEDS